MDKKVRYSKVHNITVTLLTILIFAAVAMISYSLEAKANPDLLWDKAIVWDKWYKAIEDAENPEPYEISTNLTAINKENRNLIWEGEPGKSRVLVATWTRPKPDEYKVDLEKQEYPEIWVTVVPELNNFCYRYQSSEEGDLELRLKQLLGLRPDSQKKHIVEMWVDPKYLFRPSKDPEITDHEAELDYPQSDTFITVSLDHQKWFEKQKKQSYQKNLEWQN
ncbi:MAG: hypothetical protein QNJ55_16450 [Xenococcus sp. MO_188.B8]|nr:hypothetical protein [Xenococcus sp. MO_188.B8]